MIDAKGPSPFKAVTPLGCIGNLVEQAVSGIYSVASASDPASGSVPNFPVGWTVTETCKLSPFLPNLLWLWSSSQQSML